MHLFMHLKSNNYKLFVLSACKIKCNHKTEQGSLTTPLLTNPPNTGKRLENRLIKKSKHPQRDAIKLTHFNIINSQERFRHLILRGEEDYRDIPALADFEPKLLKACFEEYIRLRTIDIKEIIEQDLTHCGDAEELECLEYLLEDESQYVNRENMLEEFRGSAAYNAMWYQGKQKVLDMINVFVEYLKNKIKKIKKEEAKLGIRDNIQNFNVQGDYIAGDKHVGAHIDNVSPGAIGTQTTKD